MLTLAAVVTQAVRLGKVARLKREAIELLGDRSKALGDRASLEISWKRALDGLWMAYQPIVQCSKRRIIAYEALMRSNEPSLPHRRGPRRRQRLGTLPELGRAVRSLVAATLTKTPIPQVFINLHPLDLLDDELPASTSPLTRMASRVVLEITERASLDDIPEVQARVASLRQLGFRIALDDVGAGYAGLNSIAQLEPEVMKIDMSLVRDMDVSDAKQKVIAAMATLCSEMNMMVIAEGVETVRERDALRRCGYDMMQGYLFAKPGPPFPEYVLGSAAVVERRREPVFSISSRKYTSMSTQLAEPAESTPTTRCRPSSSRSSKGPPESPTQAPVSPPPSTTTSSDVSSTIGSTRNRRSPRPSSSVRP